MKSGKQKNGKKRNIYEGNEPEMKNDKELNKELNKELLRLAKESDDFIEILSLTHNKNEQIRLKALRRLCPCQVGDEIKLFWDRTFELVEDPSSNIRMQVLHNMCDGSPNYMEERVVEALEFFNRDKDGDIRRKAHKVMASYSRTGKWNIL